jgi:hypothetical protein
MLWKREESCPCRESNPGRPVVARRVKLVQSILQPHSSSKFCLFTKLTKTTGIRLHWQCSCVSFTPEPKNVNIKLRILVKSALRDKSLYPVSRQRHFRRQKIIISLCSIHLVTSFYHLSHAKRPILRPILQLLLSCSLLLSKAIPVTGRGGPYNCETSRLPNFLDNRFTDGGEAVILRRRPPFTPQEDSWYSFLLDAESTPGP